jgi:Lon protease-like protein
MNEDTWALENFGGTARLFPLPNLVLFPHVVQPLHVFEPRYREMTAEALTGDRLIAMCLLCDDWEKAEGEPPIHPVACLGRIVADKVLDDGRYLLLLRGLARARIDEEISSNQPFRTARVTLLPDVLIIPAGEAQRLRRQLADLILPRFTSTGGDPGPLRELFEGEMPLGPLCDCLSYQLPLPLPRKQELLEEPDVTVRATALLATLREVLGTQGALDPPRKFPPDFSLN